MSMTGPGPCAVSTCGESTGRRGCQWWCDQGRMRGSVTQTHPGTAGDRGVHLLSVLGSHGLSFLAPFPAARGPTRSPQTIPLAFSFLRRFRVGLLSRPSDRGSMIRPATESPGPPTLNGRRPRSWRLFRGPWGPISSLTADFPQPSSASCNSAHLYPILSFSLGALSTGTPAPVWAVGRVGARVGPSVMG